jgi:hypothetical protein
MTKSSGNRFKLFQDHRELAFVRNLPPHGFKIWLYLLKIAKTSINCGIVHFRTKWNSPPGSCYRDLQAITSVETGFTDQGWACVSSKRMPVKYTEKRPHGCRVGICRGAWFLFLIPRASKGSQWLQPSLTAMESIHAVESLQNEMVPGAIGSLVTFEGE